jgi:hypothetical protein
VVTVTGVAHRLAWLQTNAQSNGVYLVEVGTAESIAPQTLSYSGRSNVTIILRGIEANSTISLSSNGSMFTVGNDVTLILDNNVRLQGRNGNNRLLVSVNGAFIMRGNTSITGNISGGSNSGGVSVFGNGSTFIMEDNASVFNNEIFGGSGGGVNVSSGSTFTMRGNASVHGNIATLNAGFGGGEGGGVTVSGTFIMEDYASVYGNTATGSIIDGITRGGQGGGVYVRGNGTFIMRNSALLYGNAASLQGGGVLVGWNGTFRLVGGTVYGNNAVGFINGVERKNRTDHCSVRPEHSSAALLADWSAIATYGGPNGDAFSFHAAPHYGSSSNTITQAGVQGTHW